MKCLLFLFLFLFSACGDHDSLSQDSIRERQQLEQKVASLNQVIKEMADEINNLQVEIDALNGMLANCEKAESAQPLPGQSEPQPKAESAQPLPGQSEPQPKSVPAEPDKQQRLLDYLENLEKQNK